MAKLNSLEGVVSNPLKLRFLNWFIFVQNLLFVVNKFHLPGHEKLIILIHLPLRTIGNSTSLQFQPLGMWSFKDLRSQHSMLSLWNSLIMRLGYKLGLLACLIVPNPCHLFTTASWENRNLRLVNKFGKWNEKELNQLAMKTFQFSLLFRSWSKPDRWLTCVFEMSSLSGNIHFVLSCFHTLYY